ncbi:hypothetical protein EV382_0353 [Micromonospora violae]|uniref:Uncharacterized protein n=1 Tax=Micromonospora violae TaxID=1278207 RepID=A0A4Q7UCQ6_9ACTN|nr:hypothetical protein EV382_0353 [Micromonospora violae]
MTVSLTVGRAGSGPWTSPIGCCWSRRIGASAPPSNPAGLAREPSSTSHERGVHPQQNLLTSRWLHALQVVASNPRKPPRTPTHQITTSRRTVVVTALTRRSTQSISVAYLKSLCGGEFVEVIRLIPNTAVLLVKEAHLATTYTILRHESPTNRQCRPARPLRNSTQRMRPHSASNSAFCSASTRRCSRSAFALITRLYGQRTPNTWAGTEPGPNLLYIIKKAARRKAGPRARASGLRPRAHAVRTKPTKNHSHRSIAPNQPARSPVHDHQSHRRRDGNPDDNTVRRRQAPSALGHGTWSRIEAEWPGEHLTGIPARTTHESFLLLRRISGLLFSAKQPTYKVIARPAAFRARQHIDRVQVGYRCRNSTSPSIPPVEEEVIVEICAKRSHAPNTRHFCVQFLE